MPAINSFSKVALFGLAFLMGLVLASHCLGQCPSSRGSYRSNYRVQAPPRVIPTAVMSVPAQPGPNVRSQRQRATAEPAINSRPASPEPTRSSAQPQLPILSADQVKSIENGQRIRLAVETGSWKEGMAILKTNGTTMLIGPERWEAGSVTVRMPQFLMEKPMPAQLFIAANPQTLLQKLDFKIRP